MNFQKEITQSYNIQKKIRYRLIERFEIKFNKIKINFKNNRINIIKEVKEISLKRKII